MYNYLLTFIIVFFLIPLFLSASIESAQSPSKTRLIMKALFQNIKKADGSPITGEFHVIEISKNEYILKLKPIKASSLECIYEVRKITSPMMTRGIMGSIVLRNGLCHGETQGSAAYLYNSSVKNFAISYYHNQNYSLSGKIFLLIKYKDKYATLEIPKLEAINE